MSSLLILKHDVVIYRIHIQKWFNLMISNINKKKSHNGVIRVKAFVIMSDDLSLILVNPTVEGES